MAAYARRVEAAAAVAAERGALTAEQRGKVVEEAAHAAQFWKELGDGQAAPPAAAGGCASARVVLVEYPINGFTSAYGLFGGALMQVRTWSVCVARVCISAKG